jgi:putative transposase
VAGAARKGPLMSTTTKDAFVTIDGVRSAPEPDEDARDRLAGLLPADALDRALKGLSADEITGTGGLLSQLAGRVIDAALAGELTDHLGYPVGEAPPGGTGNMRNGSTPKTVQTDLGPVSVNTPRDRNGTFDPQLVAKRQTRLAGLDARILDLYAGGLSVRDIQSHLETLYGTTSIGRDTISRITDQVLEDVKEWRHRPLDSVYPIVYLDALVVKVRQDRSVRKRVCYLAMGVTVDGDRDVLGLWWQESEGAKFWLAVLNDLHHRGVQDVLICCVDGLTGFPEAIEAVFPHAWVQTCVVHQIRSSMRYVAYQDRKKIAAALRPVYTAPNAEAAADALDAFDQVWGQKYPMIAASWRSRWEYIIPFLSLPADLRKAVYTTNSIEALNRQIRKSIKTRGHFPDEDAATKLIWLAITRAETKWRRAYNWTGALRGLKIHFGDRLPD